MNRDEISKDIADIITLDTRIHIISNDMSRKQRISDNPPEGEVWIFRHGDEKYKEWFDKVFPNVPEKKRNYYWIYNYGEKGDKSVLAAKSYEVRRLLVSEEYAKKMKLYEEMDTIKAKYEKYFHNVMYDMPHDGASQMVDFLQFAINIMGDLE